MGSGSGGLLHHPQRRPDLLDAVIQTLLRIGLSVASINGTEVGFSVR